MVVNVRGTGGSGKSTVVRRVMELYGDKTPIHIPNRKQPYWYFLRHSTDGVIDRQLVVPGHYEIPTGGCDTISKVDDVYKIIYGAVEKKVDVIFEGIITQDDVTRAVDLSKVVGRENMLVIVLTTSLEDCLKGIQARRDAKGDTKPLDPTNTTNRAKRVKQIASRLKDAGVTVENHDRESAFLRAKAALGWT